MADKRQEFIALAKSKIGTDNTWVCNVTGYSRSGSWCAAFVWACAKTVGLQDVIIHGCESSSNTVYYSTERGYGVWLPGPAQGRHPAPKVGDLYTKAGTAPSGTPSTYGSKHIGIVMSVSSSSYTTIDGNYTNSGAGDNRHLVRTSDHTFTDSSVQGFFRPNWSKVGVSGDFTDTGDALVTGIGSSQYVAQFNSTDSMVREVGYMTNKAEPSTTASKVKLSVVNYTPLLSEIVSQVTPMYTSSYSGTGSEGVTGDLVAAQGTIKTRSGKIITQGKNVVIPSSVNQTGIVANYTSYSYYYTRWTKGTIQKQLSVIWGQQGKPSAHGVATISGYYLVALSSKFGTTGDIVTVVLADGTTFNAILGDSKGSDAGSPWGHYLGNAVDIVEWEAVGPDTSRYVNHSSLKSGLTSAGFLGKKVSRIINYGSWING